MLKYYDDLTLKHWRVLKIQYIFQHSGSSKYTVYKHILGKYLSCSTPFLAATKKSYRRMIFPAWARFWQGQTGPRWKNNYEEYIPAHTSSIVSNSIWRPGKCTQ